MKGYLVDIIRSSEESVPFCPSPSAIRGVTVAIGRDGEYTRHLELCGAQYRFDARSTDSGEPWYPTNPLTPRGKVLKC
jgi:hypothetical protein